MSRRAPRLKFETLGERKEGESSSVEVVLSRGNHQEVGRFPLPAERTEEGVARQVALATVGAIQSFVDHEFTLELEEVDRVRTLGHTRIAVTIRLVFEGRDVQLFGSARIDDDFRTAAAKAVLDAANRYLELV